MELTGKCKDEFERWFNQNSHDEEYNYWLLEKFYELHKDATHLKNSFRKSQIVLETLFKIIFEKSKSN